MKNALQCLKGGATLLVATLTALILLAAPASVMAQQNQSPSQMEALENYFKRDYLSFGLLLQSQGEFHWEPRGLGQNTFRIPTARLKMYGELDNNFGYILQGDMTNTPALLDAKISYEFPSSVTVYAGAQKPGLSGEYLISAASTDFINRSRIVGLLASSRDVGVLMEAELTNGFVMMGGIFNGDRQVVDNSNNHFYYTGRVVAGRQINSETSLYIGLNAGQGREYNNPIGNGQLPAVNGNRTVYGGDIRLETGRFMVSGEALGAQLEFTPNDLDVVFGYHVTAGYWITPKLQFVGRFDHVESDINAFSAANLVLGGFNLTLSEAASFQLNYQLNPENLDINNQMLLVQAQLAF